jgi:hypothetical protein
MRTHYEEEIATATKLQGRFSTGDDKIVPPQNWAWFARHCWPDKCAATLASIGKRDERTAKRWLSGEFEPPNAVMVALIQKLFER